MTSRPLRLVAAMTHPVQYLSPWFRDIHAHAPELALTVVYATEPTAEQQGVGFGRQISWDVPLREGYESIVARPAAAGVTLDSDRFFGLDVPETVDAVRRLAPDLVLLSGWHSFTQVRVIRAMRRAGVPLLYRGDSHLGTSGRRWPWISRARARLMLRQFAGYLAVGSASREYLLAMGAPEPAIVTSPHAVDNDAFRARAAAARLRRAEIRAGYGFTERQRVLLYAGKLTAIKRPADVIAAAAMLDDAAVLIVGDGPEKGAVESRARSCKVPVVFAGFLNQQEIADAYVAADALIVPGRESWGVVANEALASGLPVVLSDEVGAGPDLRTPNVCAVARSGDAAAFARETKTIIDAHRAGLAGPDACAAVAARFSYPAAREGLITAASFVCRNARPAALGAPARVAALCGNFVFAGGMERATLEALAALRRGGADVRVLLNGWSSRPVAALAEQKDIPWQIGHYDAPLDGVFRDPRRLGRALADVAAASWQVARLLRQRRLTHVMAADFRAVLAHAPALVLCRLLGRPVVLRSGVAPTPGRLHAFLWRWIIAPLVTRHVANSAFIADELHLAGVPLHRIQIIRNIAATRLRVERPMTARDPSRIAYVGQIIPQKGILPLLDAVGLLVDRGYDPRLDLAGDVEGWAPESVNAYRQALRARAAQADLAGRIRFLGWREDIDTILDGAALHCYPSQPSQREGHANSVLEAKRAGLPSIVCPSGGLPEMIDHQHDGWVATGFDAMAIAEGLEWFFTDAKRLASAQDAARRSATRFDPEAFAQEWQSVFGIADARATRADGFVLRDRVTERT